MDINKFKMNSKFLNTKEKEVQNVKELEEIIKQIVIEEFESMGYEFIKS